MHRYLAVPLFVLGCCISLRPHLASADVEPPRSLDESADFWRTRKYCGVTTVYAMLRLHGVDVPYDSIKASLPVSTSGSNLEDMRLGLAGHGLPARVVKMSRQDLFTRSPFPCIAHTEDDDNARFESANRGHFVVLLRADAAKDVVEYIDGTTAEIKAMPTSNFARVWTGYLLIEEPSALSRVGLVPVTASILAVLASWGLWLLRAPRLKAVVAPAALVAMTLVPSPAAWADDVPTIDVLKRRLSEPVSRLESLFVEASILDEPLADESLIREALHKGLIKDETTTTAFKAEKRYSRRLAKRPPMANPPAPMVDESAPKPVRDNQQKVRDQFEKATKQLEAAKKALGPNRAYKASKDPTETISALGGDELRSLNTQGSSRSGRIEPRSSPTNNHFGSLYLESIGIFVDDPTAPEQSRQLRRSSMLPGVLDGGDYRVTQDRLEGVDCLKVQGSIKAGEGLVYSDTMWLDQSRGLMLLRRDFADPKGGKPLLRTVNSDPEEVVPGLWLPRRCVIEEFAPPWSPTGASRGDSPLLRTVVQATKLEANRVPDELFNLPFPAGTRVLDFVAPAKSGRPRGDAIQYFMPANPGEIDVAIQRALSEQGGAPRRWPWWFLAQLAIIPLVILAYVILKKRSRRT